MISVAVMAHRSRERWVPGLVDRLGGAEVVWDRINDRHETGLRAMLAYDPAATHHLIVQDDAVPCRDLVPALGQMVARSGEHPIGLYVGRTGPINLTLDQMMAAGQVGFVSTEGPHWGVAILLPTAHIPELAAWYEASTVPNYDKRISRWYGLQGISCWYTAPSLVDHRHEGNPSLVKGRNGGRMAAWFIGADRSALDLTFDKLLRGTAVATFRNYSTGQVVEIDADDSRFNRINRMKHRWERLDKPDDVEVEEIPVGSDDAPGPDPHAEPEESEDFPVDSDYTSGTVDEILEGVRDGFIDAAIALEHELDKDNPRKTLVEALGEIVANELPANVGGDPVNGGVDANAD